ncbi:MAG: DNA repair protein RecO [Candidatus Cryptobacteroides sp.]
MIVNTGLIVLHSTKFGDSSAVLHTLSREYGRRSFLVRSVGKKAVTTLFQPLNILEADIQETSRSKLYTARNLSCQYPLSGIRGNIYKNTMTLFLSEVLYRAVKDGTSEEGLYDWCEKNILLLDAVTSDFSNFHIRFLLELSVVLGFSPHVEDLMPFVGGHMDVVSSFMTLPFAESMLIPLSGQVRNEIADEILRYLEYHLDSSLNINSLKVLRELFA